jgi:hypothetical protein
MSVLGSCGEMTGGVVRGSRRILVQSISGMCKGGIGSGRAGEAPAMVILKIDGLSQLRCSIVTLYSIQLKAAKEPSEYEILAD